MADVLQEVVDAVTDLQSSVADESVNVQKGVDEIAKLAARLPGADPAEVTKIAASIKTAADAVRAGSKSISDAVDAVEVPPAPVA